MQRAYLSGKDLMNFLFCPRIIYYEHILKSPQFTTRKELKGREKYNDFKSKSKRNKIIKEFPKLRRIYDKTLQSEKYGIITKADCIIFNDKLKEAYPVSIKYSNLPRKIYRTQRYQLLLEAFLIEDVFNYKVPFGFMRYMLSGDMIKINTSNKHIILDIFSQISKLIKSENFPKATPYKKCCIDCCYRSKCWA